jgi:hypothetical protein
MVIIMCLKLLFDGKTCDYALVVPKYVGKASSTYLLRGISPQANNTNRATAACRQS